MKRHLFNLACLTSLLLLVVVAVLWVRSYFAHDVLDWTCLDNLGSHFCRWFMTAQSGRGRFGFSRDAEVYEDRHSYPLRDIATRAPTGPVGPWEWRGWVRGVPAYPAPGFGGAPNGRWGFHLRWTTVPGTIRREIIFPYWVVAVPAAVLPALWVRRRHVDRRRATRVSRGLCVRCGYDVRASPERCPECGTRAGDPQCG